MDSNPTFTASSSHPHVPRKGIMVLCPTKRELVHTGIWMEPGAFASWPLSGLSVLCPHCNALHPWSKKDVILV